MSFYEDKATGAQVVADRVLMVQVCVPGKWTDAQIVEFAVEYERGSGVGRDNPAFSIRRGADKHGNPERNPCAERDGYVHVMLEA